MMNACRICSCTDDDCTWCIVLTDSPCFWAEDDLCSTCWHFGQDDASRASFRGRHALKLAGKRSGKAPGWKQISDHGMQCLRVAARIEAQQRRATA